MRSHPYICPVGKITIGIGRNLEDNGLSPDEIEYLLQNDIKRCVGELERFPFWDKCNESRKAALTDLIFNLGRPRFLEFKLMIAALNAGAFDVAADELKNSLYARQLPERAEELARILREGAI
jgi:lysozyme